MNHADAQWLDGAGDGRLVTEFHDLCWLSNLIWYELQACYPRTSFSG